MKLRHAAALALVITRCLSGCTPAENHTDKQAAMAHMTFSPEKCEPVGAVYRECGGDTTLPGVDAEMVGKSNDAQLLRGVCPKGFHYGTGNGCQKD